jgi:histidinol dehydrogenase
MKRIKSYLKTIRYPSEDTWTALCKRPEPESSFESDVKEILEDVRTEGDSALFRLTEKLDGIKQDAIRINVDRVDGEVSESLKNAIGVAYQNIDKFHRSQLLPPKKIETTPGVFCWQKDSPIEKIGLYIPGGSAPLFSTLLMLAIPARIAGCKELVVCTPPNASGKVDPAIAFTASLLGIDSLYLVGGAQAIAAMAYGTETIPKVYKIFGPGNSWVTSAKQLVQMEGTAIDMPAGPSEVLVVADSSGNPAFIASDLLSQAEHGPDSQVMFVTDDERILEATIDALMKQIEQLPRKNIAKASLFQSKAVLVEDMETAIRFSNSYAPEHLIIASENASRLAEGVVNAGSVFLGNYSCESAGDYASGTNHTLPTNGYALNYSGVNLDSFMKKITFQELTPEGLMNIGPAIEEMATAEQLFAHRNAVSVRLNALESEKTVDTSAAEAEETTAFESKFSRIVRPELLDFEAYSTARHDFNGSARIYLDANESPFDTGLNRYPDPGQSVLKKAICTSRGLETNQLFLGNGSDEVIDLLIRGFCRPGIDRAAIFTPTYGMYKVFARLNGVKLAEFALDKETFQLPEIESIQDDLENVKLLFICSPNNPTGNLIRNEDIKELARNFSGLVVVDEAYIDFAPSGSMVPYLEDLPNLVVMQTFSKAMGMAGIRLGMAFAHPLVVDLLNNIKPPYNINTLTQEKALSLLTDQDRNFAENNMIIRQRNLLENRLTQLSNVIKVFHSDANFLLVAFYDPNRVYEQLLARGIIVRNRDTVIPGCLRITVGTPEENKVLLNELTSISHEKTTVYRS